MHEKRKEKNMLKVRQIVLPIAALLIIVGSTFAQPPMMDQKGAEEQGMHARKMLEHEGMIPGLSEQQLEQIRTLRTAHMKTLMPLLNQLQEKKAHLRTLTTADKVNMTEINRVIDDIGAMHVQIMKLKEQHRQDIRKMLNDEQRVFFDSHQPPRGRHPHEGMHQEREMP